jgi:uncharacterized membrane protein YdbT with pleckstrin-like domain
VEDGVAAARPAALSRTILADGEIVLLDLKPSPWFVLMVSAPGIALGVLVLLVANLGLVADLYPRGRTLLQQVGLWIIIARLIWAVLQWAARRYILTDRRLIRQKGVLNVNVFECRLDRLQNTFILRTLVQRVLGIGTIFFATAGTGGIEATWLHIRNPGDVHREITKAASRFQKTSGTAAL